MTTDNCRICTTALPKKQRRTIFSETFRVDTQLTEVLGHIPKSTDGKSKYVCFGCYGKLNTLSKIDFDLQNKIKVLKENKRTLITELRRKMSSQHPITSAATASPSDADLCVDQPSTVQTFTPVKSLQKRIIIHTPTPRKAKKLTVHTPTRKTKQLFTSPQKQAAEQKSRKRPADKLLSPNKAKVMFRSEREDRHRSRIITESNMYKVMVSIVRGDNHKTIANKLMRVPGVKEFIVEILGKKVNKECRDICKVKQPSILRNIGVDSMTDFKFKDVHEELKERAPILYNVIVNAVNKKGDLEKDKALAFSSAVLLRFRCKDMSRLHHVVGQILDLGGATDETINILSHLGISVGPDAVNRKQNELVSRQTTKIKQAICTEVKQKELLHKAEKISILESTELQDISLQTLVYISGVLQDIFSWRSGYLKPASECCSQSRCQRTRWSG